MADEEKCYINVRRERRRYIPSESKKPILRNLCPRCGSISIRKRIISKDFKCDRCGWEGASVTKIEY
jgi:predicted RNA-binding Zn-ribbon protein involved in translation (DUF1610 family)